jgi:hypothetical protein
MSCCKMVVLGFADVEINVDVNISSSTCIGTISERTKLHGAHAATCHIAGSKITSAYFPLSLVIVSKRCFGYL